MAHLTIDIAWLDEETAICLFSCSSSIKRTYNFPIYQHIDTETSNPYWIFSVFSGYTGSYSRLFYMDVISDTAYNIATAAKQSNQSAKSIRSIIRFLSAIVLLLF